MKNNRKKRLLTMAFALALCVGALCVPALAASGDVAGAVENAWTSAAGQIKTVVNNVVFPALDMILAIAFFAKLGMAYGAGYKNPPPTFRKKTISGRAG